MRDDKTLVVWNPRAGSIQAAVNLRSQLENEPHVALYETNSAEDVEREVRRVAEDFATIVAAGGDGTINAVLNGLRPFFGRVKFGVLPLGTGNDLCRTLGMPLEPLEAYHAIREGPVRSIDVARVHTPRYERFFLNLASSGNSNRVREHVTDELKASWGAWCYVRGALEVLADLQGYEMKLRFDDQEETSYQGWNLMVANGRTVAGGIPVAPRASVEDGLLDVVVVLDQNPLDMASLTAEMFLGDYLEDDRVVFRRARKVRVELRPETNFVIDGEPHEGQPLEFTVLPAALQMHVGPYYSSEWPPNATPS